ncbi:MAG: OmpA family protein, partial [Spirochaetes bacterium]|nr:OmpA family protein [Spirochaetota bacterium]
KIAEPDILNKKGMGIEKNTPIQTDEKAEFSNIIFFPDSTILKEESYPVLNQIVKILIERKNIVIEIYGHTNDIGRPENERKLSVKRSEKVKDYLVKHGVDPERIICFGFGSIYYKNKPVDEANRKVEIRIGEIE